MPPSPQSWSVRLELRSEFEVSLDASLDGGERGRLAKVGSFAEMLHELEVLFACTGEADFQLAVKPPDRPWCHLATRRWRLALYFISSQYERSFASKSIRGAEELATESGGAAPATVSTAFEPAPAFVPDTAALAAEPALMSAAGPGEPTEPVG